MLILVKNKTQDTWSKQAYPQNFAHYHSWWGAIEIMAHGSTSTQATWVRATGGSFNYHLLLWCANSQCGQVNRNIGCGCESPSVRTQKEQVHHKYLVMTKSRERPRGIEQLFLHHSVLVLHCCHFNKSSHPFPTMFLHAPLFIQLCLSSPKLLNISSSLSFSSPLLSKAGSGKFASCSLPSQRLFTRGLWQEEGLSRVNAQPHSSLSSTHQTEFAYPSCY